MCPACGGEMRIIAFIIDDDVLGANLRNLAKAETQSPLGPPGTTALSAASLVSCRQQAPVRGVPPVVAVRPAIGVTESLCSDETHQLAAPDDSGGRSKPASRH